MSLLEYVFFLEMFCWEVSKAQARPRAQCPRPLLCLLPLGQGVGLSYCFSTYLSGARLPTVLVMG